MTIEQEITDQEIIDFSEHLAKNIFDNQIYRSILTTCNISMKMSELKIRYIHLSTLAYFVRQLQFRGYLERTASKVIKTTKDERYSYVITREGQILLELLKRT